MNSRPVTGQQWYQLSTPSCTEQWTAGPGPCAHRLRLLHWDDQVQCERVVQSTSKSINFILEEILQEVTASLKNFRYKRRFCKASLTVNFSTSMTSQNISALGHSELPLLLTIIALYHLQSSFPLQVSCVKMCCAFVSGIICTQCA